jgi:YNFM family putative membrane transporter
VIGSATGVMWGHSAWPGVVAVLACALGLAVLVALRLRTLAPVAQAER